MRQKMINLCPTTYELARKMPNFSAWIRRKLLDLHDIRGDNEYVRGNRARKSTLLTARPPNHWGEEE